MSSLNFFILKFSSLFTFGFPYLPGRRTSQNCHGILCAPKLYNVSIPARILFSMLACSILVSINGCGGREKSQRFTHASCAEVAPFSEKLLPSPQALKNAQCGFLVVPENRTNLNQNSIRLAVVIVPSVSQPAAPDPVVYLAGGPGGSALVELETLVNDGINQDRDLILMSQRGTLFARPELTCPEIDVFTVQNLGVPLDSNDYLNQRIAASKACFLRLARQGIDFSAYNTVENAADFADLRMALGITEWNVFGVSYGSYLAQTLMFQHPEGIRSVTLDSVVPLENGKVVSSAAKNAREGFNSLFTACAAQSECASRYPNLAATFTNLVNKLESNAVTTRVQLATNSPPTWVALDGGVLVNWLINESFNTSDYQNVPARINELNNGIPEIIAKTYAIPYVTPPGLLAWGMAFGMICSGFVADENESDVLTQGRLAFPDYPDSVLAPALNFSYVRDDCRIWNITKTPKVQRTATPSLIPTLVLSGSFDAITPPDTGVFASRTLSNSTLLTFAGVGHGVIHASPCGQKVFTSFLSAPGMPDITCVEKLSPPVFN